MVLKLIYNENIVHGNLKFSNSQEYAQKPQRNCTFMNSASGYIVFLLIIQGVAALCRDIVSLLVYESRIWPIKFGHIVLYVQHCTPVTRLNYFEKD